MQAELVATHGLRCFTEQFPQSIAAGQVHWPTVRFVEAETEGIQGVNVNAFRKTRLAADQSL